MPSTSASTSTSITCSCPRYVLPRLISILISRGATISPSLPLTPNDLPAHIPISGTITYGSGTLVTAFHHVDNQLTVTITKSPGYFPKSLIINGILQLIEETVESEDKSRAEAKSIKE